MHGRACIVVLAVLTTYLALAAVAGHSPLAPQTLITLTENHGVEVGDVPVAVAWTIGMGCLAALWPRP